MSLRWALEEGNVIAQRRRRIRGAALSGVGEEVRRALYLNLDELRRWLVTEYPEEVKPSTAATLVCSAARGYAAWLRRRRRTGKDYRLPRPPRKIICVDKGLDAEMLDRLNLIPGIKVVSTCQGHPKGAHIGFRVLRGGELNEAEFAEAVGAHQRARWLWIEPPTDPPAGGGVRWFDGTVERMERAAASQLRRAE